MNSLIPLPPPILYTFYGGTQKIYNDRVNPIVSSFVFSTDVLPKLVLLDGEEVLVNKIDIIKNNNDGFSIYAQILVKQKEEKIGFWYTKDSFGTSLFGGVLGITTSKWIEPPTEEEIKQKIRGTSFSKGIYLTGVDYDVSKERWNFIQLNLSLYVEKLYPLEEL